MAGKTGTGQGRPGRQYAAGEVASFIGMAPADAPRYVIAVFAHTPGGNGGEVAGPAFTRDDGVHAAPLPGAADRHPAADVHRTRDGHDRRVGLAAMPVRTAVGAWAVMAPVAARNG